MAPLTITRIKTEMHAAGIAPAQQAALLAGLQKPPTATAWDNLLRPLADAVRTTKGGLPRARPSRQPIYAAYLQLMQKTYAHITYAQRNHATPAEAADAAAAANKTRVEHGKRPLGECRSHWSTWIPPHVVDATIAAFEDMYAEEVRTNQPPGRRIHPFSTLTQRGTTQNKWKTLLAQLQPHINAGFEIDPSYVEVHTRDMDPDRAEFIGHAMVKLHKERYRAAFEARKIIQRRMKSLSTDFIVPLHWIHVLDDDARAHLRAAERAAGGDGYTRDVGVFSNAPLVPDAPASDPHSMSSHGFILPRPDDKLTTMSEDTAREKARRDAFYAKVKAEGDAELHARLEGDDL